MKRITALLVASTVALISFSGLAGAAVFSTNTVDLPHAYVSGFGSSGTGSGQFSEPTDVKLNPVSGDWVVVDHNNHRLQIFSSPGVFNYQLGTTGVPGSGPGEFNFPRAVAFNPLNGDMYVTDTDNNRVQIFDELGAYVGEFGSPGGVASSANGEFDFPTGIAFDAPFGNVVLVVDSGNNRIQQFSAAGVYQGQFGSPGGAPSFAPGEFNFPVGICTDGAGNIYVTERTNHRVQHLEPTGFFLNEFGSLGTGPGQFNNPIAVQHTTAGGGRVYVSDWVNNRIQVFDNGGTYLDEFGGFGISRVSGAEGIQIQGDDLWVANGFADKVNQFRAVPGIGDHNSLAEKDGFLYLSTYDATNQDLIYGIKVDWGWEFYVLDSAGDVGQYSSLVLDSAGRPHISYHEAPGTLKYVTTPNFGVTWNIETVRTGPGTFGRGTSIALNSADEPRIAYGDELGETLEFSERIGGFWVDDPGPSPGSAFSVSLAMDDQDRPHIAFWDPQQTSTDLIRYTTRDGVVWNTELVDSTSVSSAIGHVSLALDRAGNARVAYQILSELRYAERISQDNWQVAMLDDFGAVNTGQYNTLALDPIDGSPRIAYMTDDSDFYYVNFASWNLGSWSTQTVAGENPGSGEFVTMALDASGNPRLVYSGSLKEASGALLNAHYASPNTVSNDGLKSITLYGTNVAYDPPLVAQLEEADGIGLFNYTGVSTTGPDVLTLDFSLAGATPGAYHLILLNSAGPDTLLNAVVIHDETVDLNRVTTRTGVDRFARYTKPGTLPERVAFMSGRTGSAEIYAKEPLLPDVEANLTLVPTVGSPSGLDWSADGTRIVYRNDLDEELYTVTLANGNTYQELTSGGGVITPAWSPVDDLILYNAGSIFSTIDIFTIEAGSDIIDQITAAAGQEVFFSPEFSPDGQAVAAVFADSTFAPTRTLVRMSADGSSLTTLADPGALVGSPAWSPDGQWIAYVVDSGNSDIWLISSNGEVGPIQVTADPAGDFSPLWSADGQTLYFVSDRVDGSAGLGTDIFSADVSGLLADTDGDLVPDVADACPTEAPALGQVDRDFDGCADPTSSFRFMRFWSEDQLPLSFETDAVGDSTILDGSDFTVLDASFAAWTQAPVIGTNLAGGDDLTRGGLSDAIPGDRRNSITFLDPDGYDFGTIALTVSAVAVGDTVIGGRWYRPGEIVDADILFNTFHYDFETPSAPGPAGAYSLGSVATHEFGHFFGLGHSGIPSATMFYVVFKNTDQETLEEDDAVLARRGYSDPAGLPLPLAVQGTVFRGEDGITPVVGAAVFAMDTATGDTLQMTLTDLNGIYRFYIPGSTDFRIYVHPLDGSAGISGLTPGRINLDFATVAETDFLPEYYDVGDNNSDFGSPGSVVNSGSFPLFGADILTNPDLSAPQVLSTFPAEGDTVSATTAVTVLFDDRIDLSSINNATFALNELFGPGVGGSVALLKFDSLLVFQPDTLLNFDTDYVLRIGSGISDQFGNAMPDTMVVNFRVGSQPPATVLAVSPAEAPVGGALVIQGTGFSPTPTANEVFFDGGVSGIPFSATLEQLVVTVPTGAQSGSLFVNVNSGAQISNTFPITIIPQRGVPLGTALGTAPLGGDPRRVDVGPNGVYAYVAHSNGVTAVKADPQFGDFLTDTADMTLPGGSRGVVVLPDGLRALAISSTPPRLSAIDADTGSVFLNTVITGSEVSLPREPLGIAAVPGGSHVLIAYSGRVVKHIAAAGASFGLEVAEWKQDSLYFAGDVSVSVDGAEAYATTTDGQVAVLGLDFGEGIVGLLPGGPNLRELAGRPDGQRFLGVDEVGTVREYGKRGPLLTQTVQPGGYTGLVLSPEGGYGYAANFILNKVDVLSLTGSAPSPVSNIATGIDPTDVTTGSGGRYLYVTTASSDLLEVFDTEVGPVISGISPQTVTPGGLVTLIGLRFAPGNTSVNINGGSVLADSVRSDSTALVFSVPPDIALGTHPLSVTAGGLMSNTVNYKAVNRPDQGALLSSLNLTLPTVQDVNTVLESPSGDYLITTHSDASMLVHQADPSQTDFLRDIQSFTPTETGFTFPTGSSTHRLVFTPDGSKLYGVNGNVLNTFDITPGGTTPFALGGNVITTGGALALLSPENMAVTPDGQRLLATDVEGQELHVVNTANDSLEATFSVPSTVPAPVAVHPNGSIAFVGDFYGASNQPMVNLVDINEDSPSYGQVVDTVLVTGTGFGVSGVLDLKCTPDGTKLIMMSQSVVGLSGPYDVHIINVDPGSAGYLTPGPVVEIDADTEPALALNHSGTVLFSASNNVGEVRAYDVTTSTAVFLGNTGFSVQFVGSQVAAMSRDDGRVYTDGIANNIMVVDVTGAGPLSLVSGSGQVAVVNQPAPLPIVVQPTGTNTEGNLIIFTAGTGDFGFGDQTLYTAVGENGQASATYIAGAVTGADFVNAVGVFENTGTSVTVVADPTLSPPQLISVLPGPTSAPGVNTTVVADFSKAVNPASVNNTSFIVREGPTPLAGTYSFANSNTRAVFTPTLPLGYSTTYQIELTAGVVDNSANALLGAPVVSNFTTAAAPVLVLNSIQSSSAVPGNSVVLAGTNFQGSPAGNLVTFGSGGVSAVPTAASTRSLTVTVPFGATTGDVRVITNPGTTPDTSNARSLTVLPSSTTPVSEVVDVINVPVSGQQIAVLPDGSRSYMTSAGANTLVPVNLATTASETAITTGQHPYGVAANSASNRVYVTNFFSHTVSVIATDPDSANFHTVVATIPTGLNPTGVAVHPGDHTVYVVNYGDSTLSIIDTDPSSAGFNSAKSTVNTSKSARTVALSPDGASVVLGTSDGIIILDSTDGSAKTTVDTGKSSRSIALTPDGAYAVILTDDNFLLLIDIQPGTPDADRAKSSVNTGKAGRSIALSPDGAFVYVTTTDDQVLVFQVVTVGGSAAVTDAQIGQFDFQLVATINVGENPNGMAIDLSTNTLLVVNEGSKTITFINISDVTVGPVETILKMDPNSLSLKSKGKFINAALQFPIYLDPADLVLTSVLMNGTLGPDTTKGVVLLDKNEDLIDEAHIKFKRPEVFDTLPEGQAVPVVLTGLVGDRAFTARDTIRVFRPKLKTPGPGSAYGTNVTLAIQWDPAPDGPAHHMDIFWSPDLGASWDTVVTGTEDDSSYAWTTPEVNSSDCLVMVVAYDSKGDVSGIGGMDQPFTISESVGVEGLLPARFALLPASPNPFMASTNIRFDLPEAAPVTLQIFGLDGSLVRALAKNTIYPAGRHAVLWDGRNLRGQRTSGGVYFLRIQAGPEKAVRKIVRLRR